MTTDIILIVIVLGSYGYALYLLLRRVRHIANINVSALPENRQMQIKRQILEEKLRRDLHKRWTAVKSLISVEQRARVTNSLRSVYKKLKDLEYEYRVMRKQDLSTRVTKLRSIEELMGDAREQLNAANYTRAEQLLIECLKIDEHNVRVYRMLAQVYKDQGDYEHAKETLEYLLKLTHHEDPSVYRGLASLAKERGDLHTAQEDYLRSISLDPKNYNYNFELADVYRAMNQHEQAQEHAQAALVLAPNNPKILDFLVENSIILQDKNQAADYLSKLRDANPHNGKIKSFEEQIGNL